ncbi:MAG TPA: RagB/SusD family nutrient uptake outer membrane protein [Cyclobacteriaceae bacterium]|nr:RagB/SusD family nutrient uptake outer membrane protein [Cyclobacteriaceae bacterium]
MKKMIRTGFVSALAVGALLYSCKDSFLEVAPPGALNSALLTNARGLDAALLAAYSQVNGRANRMASPSNWVWGSIRGGENNKGTDPGDFNDINPIQRFEALPTQGVINDKWNGNYEGVARCNAVMKLLVAAQPDVTAAQKTSIEAQTRFLRAHYYFELARAFDKTPYVDEKVDVVADATTNTTAGIAEVKNDKSLWPFIEADMAFAAANLPPTQAAVGRVNSWAAKAYLAKIYLYEKKYDLARTTFTDVITNGVTSNGKKYNLVPKFADVFKASNDNHEESVWAYQAAAGTGSVNNANPEFDLNWPYNTGPDGPGNCCSFFQPTFEMGNKFRTTPAGLPFLDGSYNDPANELKNDMGLETKDPFDPDTREVDPRLDHTIGRRGIPYLDWPGVKDLPGVFPGKAWIRNQPNAGPYQTKKFVYYQTDKGSLQDNSSWTPGYTAINFPIIRFADVLLLAAEAEVNGGSLATAMTYVNRVRARAMNPDGFVKKGGVNAANYVISLYTAAHFADAATAMKTIAFERNLELSGEGHRFFDLVRWGIAKDEINKYLAYESKKLPGALGDAGDKKGYISPEDDYLPIPQAQIDLVGKDVLKQNPGYGGN